jgi:hypothetical protein
MCLDLEHGAGQLASLSLHRGRDAEGGERAADDAAGEPEELDGFSGLVSWLGLLL